MTRLSCITCGAIWSGWQRLNENFIMWHKNQVPPGLDPPLAVGGHQNPTMPRVNLPRPTGCCFSRPCAREACTLLFARFRMMLKRPTGFHMGNPVLDYAVPRKWTFAGMKAIDGWPSI